MQEIHSTRRNTAGLQAAVSRVEQNIIPAATVVLKSRLLYIATHADFCIPCYSVDRKSQL